MAHEEELCRQLINGLNSLPDIKIYRSECKHVPIVAFNIGDINSQEAANYLSDNGYALRGGIQCAALAHNTLGTTEQGVIRFSPSAFNNKQQVSGLLNTIKRYKP